MKAFLIIFAAYALLAVLLLRWMGNAIRNRPKFGTRPTGVPLDGVAESYKNAEASHPEKNTIKPMQSPNTGVGRKLCPTPSDKGVGSLPCSAIKCDHCGNKAEFRADNRKASTHGWQFVCYPCSLNPVFYNVQILWRTAKLTCQPKEGQVSDLFKTL